MRLNSYENIALAKRNTGFLLNFDSWRHDNSNNSEVINKQETLLTRGIDNVSDFVYESESELSPDLEELANHPFIGKQSLKNVNRTISDHVSLNLFQK